MFGDATLKKVSQNYQKKYLIFNLIVNFLKIVQHVKNIFIEINDNIF